MTRAYYSVFIPSNEIFNVSIRVINNQVILDADGLRNEVGLPLDKETIFSYKQISPDILRLEIGFND